MVLASWHFSDNFGDALTPWIINKLGFKAEYVLLDDERLKVLVTGSILENIYLNSCDVWGCGVIQKDSKIKKANNLYAVRGPISASLCPQEPSCIGDPGLLIPLLMNIPKPTKELAIMPSWVDHQKCKEDYPDIPIINVIGNVDKIIKEMCSYRNIICSCLHGLIACCACGIKTRWVQFSDNLVGDGTKFHDFLQSINADQPSLDLRQKHNGDLVSLCHKHPDGKQLANDLLTHRPKMLK